MADDGRHEKTGSDEPVEVQDVFDVPTETDSPADGPSAQPPLPDFNS